MPAIHVLKFGGTSVKNIARMQHVAEIVQSRSRSAKVIVVVSAMGDTTDHLQKLASQCGGSVDRRELDMLLATGEQQSIALLAMILRSNELRARSFTGSQLGILTEPKHGDAKIVDVCRQRIFDQLEENDILVVAGFQGTTLSGEITTLGRGGSDTTAVALAAAVGAERCEIFTDVRGIYSADPNCIDEAALISEISYDHCLELAARGAQVLHPRAVLLAKQFSVPVVVRSTFDTNHPGTILKGAKTMETRAESIAVSIHKRAALISCAEGQFDQCQVASICLEEGCTPLSISTDSTLVTYAEGTNPTRLAERLRSLPDTRRVVLHDYFALVSVIGNGFLSRSAPAAKAFAAFSRCAIRVAATTVNELSIIFAVPRDSAQQAALALHQAFDLGSVQSVKREEPAAQALCA